MRNKSTKTQINLSQYNSLDFGIINLSPEKRELYQILNREMPELCRGLPESARDRAIDFLMAYGRVTPGGPLDFFSRYYPPAWSVIYHIHGMESRESDNSRINLHTALGGQALAMFLHSYDDHLNDGDIPASHLALLVRSAAWMRFNNCIKHFADKTPESAAIAENLINDYYAGMMHGSRIQTLEQYCSLFRKQMATWLVMPLCTAKSLETDDSVTGLIRKSYESFGVAWRLLDDVNDLEEDLTDQRPAAPYWALPDKHRRLWDIKNKKERLEKITSILIKEAALKKIIRKIDAEMKSAEKFAEQAGLHGLAAEYSELRRPVALFLKNNLQESFAETGH